MGRTNNSSCNSNIWAAISREYNTSNLYIWWCYTRKDIDCSDIIVSCKRDKCEVIRGAINPLLIFNMEGYNIDGDRKSNSYCFYIIELLEKDKEGWYNQWTEKRSAR